MINRNKDTWWQYREEVYEYLAFALKHGDWNIVDDLIQRMEDPAEVLAKQMELDRYNAVYPTKTKKANWFFGPDRPYKLEEE